MKHITGWGVEDDLEAAVAVIRAQLPERLLRELDRAAREVA